MTLHPQCDAFLELGRKANAPDISELGLFLARNGSHLEPDISGPIDPSVNISIEYLTSPTSDIPVAIFRPASEGVKPAMVYYHGGGWVLNYISKYYAQLAELSKNTNSIIIAVNYQKAPEHKFPIPFDDCYAGLEWTFANAERLGIDSKRVGVGGDSAGGNLASAVALAARDRGKYSLVFQLLIYPCNGADFVDSTNVPNADGYGLTQRGMKWLWDMYLNRPEDESNPYAVPHAAKSYVNLPPTIMITAEFDVLREDGRAYLEKLKTAGNKVIYKDYPGMIHGFFNYGKYIDEGITVRSWLAKQINDVVGL